MDNSPLMIAPMLEQGVSRRVQLLKLLNLVSWAERRRKDTSDVPAEERISTLDLHAVYDLIRGLRRQQYDGGRITAYHNFQVVDVTFNCILIRANQYLQMMASELGVELPADIRRAMRLAPHTLETLWDDETQHYYNRNGWTGKLIRVEGISTFMPLYALQLAPERIKALVGHLHNPETYGTPYPIPSTPVNSTWFRPKRYWQGPTWVNMNWMIAEGLERNGEASEARALRERTLEMVASGGMHEYFSPLDATPAGAPAFSWTAALVIDLLERGFGQSAGRHHFGQSAGRQRSDRAHDSEREVALPRAV
jgi:glycogen debranching enzyme